MSIPARTGIIASARTTVSSDVPSWNPDTDISSIYIHLKAEDLAGTLANSAQVTAWTDTINSLTYTTLSGSPTFRTNVINSLPSVYYIGAVSSRMRNINTITFNDGGSIIMVTQQVSNATQQFFMRTNSGNIFALKRTTDDIDVGVSSTDVNMAPSDVTPSVAVGNPWIYLLNWSTSGASISVYINSITPDVSDSVAGGTAVEPSYFWLPCNTAYADMHLSEFLYYEKYLSASEINSLMDYYKNKYSI